LQAIRICQSDAPEPVWFPEGQRLGDAEALYALAAHRPSCAPARAGPDPRVVEGIHLSINGIAAGLRNSA
jgi:hypothetical protein